LEESKLCGCRNGIVRSDSLNLENPRLLSRNATEDVDQLVHCLVGRVVERGASLFTAMGFRDRDLPEVGKILLELVVFVAWQEVESREETLNACYERRGDRKLVVDLRLPFAGKPEVALAAGIELDFHPRSRESIVLEEITVPRCGIILTRNTGLSHPALGR